MGSKRTVLVVTAAALALPSIAFAQEQEHVFVTGAMQDREQRVTVLGAAQDQEHVYVTGAAQDREQRVTVLGSADDQRTVAGPAASRTLQTVPVVYEDEPAPAPAPATTPQAAPQAPAAPPRR